MVFGRFGGIPEKAQKKITEACYEIDTLVHSHTLAIERKLRKMHVLPSAAEPTLLNEGMIDNEKDETEDNEPLTTVNG
jgi:DNA recombination protein RmuC